METKEILLELRHVFEEWNPQSGTDGSIGEFVCKDMESHIDFCAGHMASDAWQEK